MPPLGGIFYGRIEGGVRNTDAVGWFGSGAAGNGAGLLPAGPCAAYLGQSGDGCDAASYITERVMSKLTAYSFKLRKNVVISDPKLVILKNGRPAVRGVAEEDPDTAVFRIVSAAEAEKLRAAGIAEEQES